MRSPDSRDQSWPEEASETGVPHALGGLASAPIGTARLLEIDGVLAGLEDLPEQPGHPLGHPLATTPGEPSRARPLTPEETLEAVLWLSRELTVDLDAREMIARFVRALRELLPRRALCVRLLDGPDGQVAQAALGGLILGESDPDSVKPAARVLLKRSALARLRLRADVEDAPGVTIVDQYEPLFESSAGGFSVPLAAAGDLQGAVYVEYIDRGKEGTAWGRLATGDEPAVIALANQLAVALRNVRLVNEARFLRDYLSQILEHSRALILAVDRDGVITVLNQAMARALGVRRRDVLGCRLHELAGLGDGFDRLREALVRALDGADGEPLDVALAPNEETPPLRAVFTLTGVGLGPRRDAAVAVGQDQTALRHLERQVIQAEKLATLGQLAAGVVHEINNPLTSIVAYAGYLARKSVREERDLQDVERLRKITESAERIQNFTRDLVSYARPAPEQPELLRLGEVVLQALSFCEHVVAAAGASVEQKLARELPPIRGIKAQLQQIFINLITNACHALGEQGGTLLVETWAPDDGHVAARIVDDGIGIRPEHLPSIFEPFFSTKTQGQGTGLGLSIVRNIVDAHKGRIDVTSTVDQGASFTVVLPITPLPAQAYERTRSP